MSNSSCPPKKTCQIAAVYNMACEKVIVLLKGTCPIVAIWKEACQTVAVLLKRTCQIAAVNNRACQKVVVLLKGTRPIATIWKGACQTVAVFLKRTCQLAAVNNRVCQKVVVLLTHGCWFHCLFQGVNISEYDIYIHWRNIDLTVHWYYDALIYIERARVDVSSANSKHIWRAHTIVT